LKKLIFSTVKIIIYINNNFNLFFKNFREDRMKVNDKISTIEKRIHARFLRFSILKNRSKRRFQGGFTLVEVIMAVIIASFLSYGYLKVHGTSLHFLDLIDKRLETNEYSSFIFSQVSKDLHEKKKSVKEFVETRYNIDDDELLEYFDKVEYRYTQEELYFLNFGEFSEENENESDSDSLFTEYNENDSAITDEIKKNGVLVETVKIHDENNNSVSLYHFSFLK
jgi:prepilin-type N-terminal cleavage/methylation domain-containing protein